MSKETLEKLRAWHLRQRSLPVIADGPMFHRASPPAATRTEAPRAATEQAAPAPPSAHKMIADFGARLAARRAAAPAPQEAPTAPPAEQKPTPLRAWARTALGGAVPVSVAPSRKVSVAVLPAPESPALGEPERALPPATPREDAPREDAPREQAAEPGPASEGPTSPPALRRLAPERYAELREKPWHEGTATFVLAEADVVLGEDPVTHVVTEAAERSPHRTGWLARISLEGDGPRLHYEFLSAIAESTGQKPKRRVFALADGYYDAASRIRAEYQRDHSNPGHRVFFRVRDGQVDVFIAALAWERHQITQATARVRRLLLEDAVPGPRRYLVSAHNEATVKLGNLRDHVSLAQTISARRAAVLAYERAYDALTPAERAAADERIQPADFVQRGPFPARADKPSPPLTRLAAIAMAARREEPPPRSAPTVLAAPSIPRSTPRPALCSLCANTGSTAQGFCACPAGTAKHARELAMTSGPVEVKHIKALLVERAESAPGSASPALLAAAERIAAGGYRGEMAVALLRGKAMTATAGAREALEAAAEAVERGEHLPPPLPTEVAEANAIADYLIANTAPLVPADAAAAREAAESIRHLALTRTRASAHLSRLARKAKAALAAWLENRASDIAVGAFSVVTLPAQPGPTEHEPEVEAGPATLAHGNESPRSRMGAPSFDPAHLGAPSFDPASFAAPPVDEDPLTDYDEEPEAAGEGDDGEPAPAEAGDEHDEPPPATQASPSAPVAAPLPQLPQPPPEAAHAEAIDAPRGIRVFEEEGRVKVRFPERPRDGSPEAKAMAALKAAGFTWYKVGGAWTKRASDEARRQAREAVALAAPAEPEAPAAPSIVLTHDQASARLVTVLKQHGVYAIGRKPEPGSWRKHWTVEAWYVDRVGLKKKYHQQDLGEFQLKDEGGVGLDAVEATLRDQRHLTRTLLARAFTGVRVLSLAEEQAGAVGTPDAPMPDAPSAGAEELPGITRDEAATRVAKALREAGLGSDVLVTIEQGKDKHGNAALLVYARATAKKNRKFVEVSYGRFIIRQRGGVGLDAVRAEYGEREPQARLALERALAGVRVPANPGYVPPPPEGTDASLAPSPAAAAERRDLEPLTRLQAAERLATALGGVPLGLRVDVVAPEGNGGTVVVTLHQRRAKKPPKGVYRTDSAFDPFGNVEVRASGGDEMQSVRVYLPTPETDATRKVRTAVARALKGRRVIGVSIEPPPAGGPPPAEPPPPPTPAPSTSATLVASGLVAGGPRAEYVLPDGGRLEVGRVLGGKAIALHHPRPRSGDRMRSLDLVSGREVPAPVVEKHAAPSDEDRLLLAALAADMGSAQAKADHAAALRAIPEPPPPLSARALTIGPWELLHDRNANALTLRRKPLTGFLATTEEAELGALGLVPRGKSAATAAYSPDLWTRVAAWAQAHSAEPSAALAEPVRVPAGGLAHLTRWTRMSAAERIAEFFGLRGYAVEVVAPAGPRGSIRVSVARGGDATNRGRDNDGAAGWVWMLLDGRVRVDAASLVSAERVVPELEALAREALGGRDVEPEPRAEARTIGPFEVLQDDAGGWIARTERDAQGGTFTTREQAEAYARRLAPQHDPQAVGAGAFASIKGPTTGTDPHGNEATLQLAEVRIDHWKDGAPVVQVPFVERRKGETRRGLVWASEDVARDYRGHFSLVHGYVGDDGERWGAGPAPEWMRGTLSAILAALPAQPVDFDGARVEPVPGAMLVHLDAEPTERARRELRRGKFRRSDAGKWSWTRDRDRDDEAWWWARHVAITVQNEREHARRDDRAPASYAPPLSHRNMDAAERIRAVRNSIGGYELHMRADTRRLLREPTEAQAREVGRLLVQRDDLQEAVRLYRDDGSRRPMGEEGPELRDFRAPLPDKPTRIARGVDLWERGGRVYVRLGAEPGTWLGEALRERAFLRSRKQGEERIWWQASSPLASYWGHWLAEYLAETDATRPEMVAERFAGELPVEEEWTAAEPVKAEPVQAAPAPKIPERAGAVVTVPMRLAESIAVEAQPGQDVSAWEAAAQGEAAFESDHERETTIRVVRERVLTVERGLIVADDWLGAFRKAWGSERRLLLAARLFADQPLVVAAAELARAARERAEEPLPPNDAPAITDEALEALFPPGTSKAERQRGRRALTDALVALGLAEKSEHGKQLRAHRPEVAPAAWGWLLRHELRRAHRSEAPEAWAMRKSLAARLLGYGEGSARYAMDTAYTQGWVRQSQLAGEPRILFIEEAERRPASRRVPEAQALPPAPTPEEAPPGAATSAADAPAAAPAANAVTASSLLVALPKSLEGVARIARKALEEAKHELATGVDMRARATAKLARVRSEESVIAAKRFLGHAHGRLYKANEHLSALRVALGDHEKLAAMAHRHSGATIAPPVTPAEVDELARQVEGAVAEARAQEREVWPDLGSAPPPAKPPTASAITQWLATRGARAVPANEAEPEPEPPTPAPRGGADDAGGATPAPASSGHSAEAPLPSSRPRSSGRRPQEAAPAPAVEPAPVEAFAPPSIHGGYRVVNLLVQGRPEPGTHFARSFYRIESSLRARLAAVAGFDAADWKHDQSNTTPLIFGRPEDIERIRDAFVAALPPDAVVEVNDYATGQWRFGRTTGLAERDLPEVTRELEGGAERVVAVDAVNLGWQVARWGGSWTPFDPSKAAPMERFHVGDGGLVRHMSDGTWVVFGSHLSDTDPTTVSIHEDLPSALITAEHRHVHAPFRRHPIAVEHKCDHAMPAGVPAARVKVVDWKDGGPVVEFPLLMPSGEKEERGGIVRAYLPSGARRTKGDESRRVEKVDLTVTRDGAPVRFGYHTEQTVKRLAYETIQALPAEAHVKPKDLGATRTPAPFKLGQHVRYTGPARDGLEPGTLGVVDHLRRARAANADVAEIVLGKTHVELVAAGPDAALYEPVSEEIAPDAPKPEQIPEKALGRRAVLSAFASRTRGAVALLGRQISTHETLASSSTYGREDHLQSAERAKRELWRQERILRLAEAALKDAPPEEPAPAPEPLAVPENIDELRAAFADKRDGRIDRLRGAAERRSAEGEALYKQTKTLLDHIPLGQPNIMDTVSGRRFARQREKLHERHERSWKLIMEGAELHKRADAAENNSAVFSDDPDAIDKLKAAIAEREAAQEYVKEVNVAARAGDRAKLAELGLDEAKIEKVLKPNFAGRVGFDAYVLANNNNQIRRLRERVAFLEKQRREGPKEPEQYGAIEVREEDNRVRIFFPGKPSEPDRQDLRRSGFKWSPTAGAWQRHANAWAWQEARQIARRLGGPPPAEPGAPEPAEAAGTSELAKLVMRILTRAAEASNLGLADVGDVVSEARTFSNHEKEEVHAALRELEDGGLIELRSWGRPPPGARVDLAPAAPDGKPLAYARPLTPAGRETSDDPIIGYRLLLTLVIDHPERRGPSYPFVQAGQRFDLDEPLQSAESGERQIAALRAGRTDYDTAAEYVAEVGVSVQTRLRRFAGWVSGPESRTRPEGSDQ
jgi:hypothetical protein